MKFSVVIGNPPYTRGIDLDFVNIGFEVVNSYCVFIVPAKWETAEDDKLVSSKTITYGGFRDKIVPYISEIVFYPNCADLFEIKELSGISYYLIDKNRVYSRKRIINICKTQKYFNSIEDRELGNRDTLHNIGNEIINYLRPYNSFEFRVDNSSRYGVYLDSKITCDRGKPGTYQSYGFTSYKTGKATVLSASEIVDRYEANAAVTDSTLVFTSDNIDECNSFISWLYTKFVRFFIAMNISKMTGMDNEVFRFVPSLPLDSNGNYNWSKQYTDDSLYKVYGLDRDNACTKDGVKYIDIIEAVINERK